MKGFEPSTKENCTEQQTIAIIVIYNNTQRLSLNLFESANLQA